jgi:hypothetical protein
MLADARGAAEPAASRLAAIEPAAGPVAAAEAPARGWPVASAAPRPIEHPPALAADEMADPATLRVRRRLLKFRTPAELVAEHPCPGSGRAVFCSLPAAGFSG